MTTLYLVLGGVAAILAAIAGAFFKGRSSGASDVVAKQQKANNETQAEFNKIDAAKPDLDGALDRLRKRSE